MFNLDILKIFFSQKWVQVVGLIMVGICIGRFTQSTVQIEKKIREEVKVEYEEKIQQTIETDNTIIAKLNEKISITENQFNQYKDEVKSKIDTLTTENSKLKQSTHKEKYRIVRPDGTIEEREIESSNIEQENSLVSSIKQEYEKKIEQIENKLKTEYEDKITSTVEQYKNEIVTLETRHKEELLKRDEAYSEIKNPKRLRLEGGYTLNKEIYVHSSYDILSPIFIGGHVSGTMQKIEDVGVGVGIQF